MLVAFDWWIAMDCKLWIELNQRPFKVKRLFWKDKGENADDTGQTMSLWCSKVWTTAAGFSYSNKILLLLLLFLLHQVHLSQQIRFWLIWSLSNTNYIKYKYKNRIKKYVIILQFNRKLANWDCIINKYIKNIIYIFKKK